MAVAALLAAAGAGYSWWATGVRPFTITAYVAVGVPVLVVALGALTVALRADRWAGIESWRTDHPARLYDGWRRALPWIVLAGAGLGLEIAGLSLGGRSTRLPTVSTVVDHALRWHGTRSVLFGTWLACGAALLVVASSRGTRR